MTPFESLVKSLQGHLDDYYRSIGRPAYADLAVKVDNMTHRMKIVEVVVDNAELKKDEWKELEDLIQDFVDDEPKNPDVQFWRPILAKLKIKVAAAE